MAKRKNKIISRKFNSLFELSNYIKNTPANCLRGKSEWGGSDDDGFYNTTDFAQATNYMLNGWDYGTGELVKAINADFDGQKIVKKLSLSVVGALPCVAAYLAGSPKSMLKVTKTKKHAPIIRVIYCSGALGSVKAQEVIDTGARVFNAFRAIEAAGVRVELYAGNCAYSSGDTEKCGMFVKIKDTDHPLNPMSMAYCFVHSSFQRRHGFAFRERSGLTNKLWSGYGSTYTSVWGVDELARAAGIDGAKILTFYSCRNLTTEQIIEQLTKK